MLKPIDVVVLSGLLLPGAEGWNQVELAHKLHLSQPSVHRALKQLERSGLRRRGRVQRGAAGELIVHGVRYVYPVEPGPLARGLPTAHAGPGLADLLTAEQPYVWPCEPGPAVGPSLAPLHPSVPRAALGDRAFHELMALLDVFRVGRVRERKLAEAHLLEILGTRDE